MGLILSALRAPKSNRILATRKRSKLEDLSTSNECSKENEEISPSSIEKEPTTNFCYDPVEPVYETCGIRISLRGCDLPKEVIIIHSLPEGLDHFDTLRSENRDCDAVIVVGAKKMNVHKALLSARIPYFKNLLSHNWRDSTSSEFSISEVDYSSMEYLLDYAYTGNLFISQKNVQDMMSAANYLGMERVMDDCAEFMRRRIRFDDTIPLIQFLRSIQFSKIDSQLLRFMDTNFVPISLSDEFLQLSIDELSNILERNSLHVFQAVDRWISVDKTRVQFGPRLLKLVRCSLLSSSFLNEIVETKEWIKDNEECIEIVNQALNNDVLNSSNISQRVCYDAHRLIFSTGFQDESEDLQYQLFDPLQNKWTDGIYYNCPLFYFDCVSIGHKIISINFKFDGPSILIILDTQTNQWSEVMSTGRSGEDPMGDIQVIDARIYVVCTDSNEDFTMIESIDPFDRAPVWTKLANMNKNIYYPATCAYEGKLYVIGGSVNGMYGWALSDAQVYDPNTNTFSPIAPMKTRRRGCTAAVFNGEIYVCGGRNEDRCAEFEKYSPMTNTWTTLKNMNTARYMPGLIVSSGMMYALGGNCSLKTVERYDPERDCWENTPSMGDYHEGIKIVCALPVPASFPTPLPYRRYS